MEANNELRITDEEQARIENTDTAVIVTLETPIVYSPSGGKGECTLDRLTLPRVIRGRHLVAMDSAQGEFGKAVALIAALAGIPARVGGEIAIKDVDLVMRALAPFLPSLDGAAAS